MWSDKGYLEQLVVLYEKGLLKHFELGDVVARGFADVGFEEYIVLANMRICSLYTGKIGELSENNLAFYFLVPSLQQLGDIIGRWGFDNIKIESELGAFWSASFLDTKLGEHYVSERQTTPHEALVRLFVSVIESTE
jgi:hypothetical protein